MSPHAAVSDESASTRTVSAAERMRGMFISRLLRVGTGRRVRRPAERAAVARTGGLAQVGSGVADIADPVGLDAPDHPALTMQT